MHSHRLGVLEPSVVLHRDPGRSPGVISNGVRKPARFGPLSNRGLGVVAVQRARPFCCSRINSLEQRLPALEAYSRAIAYSNETQKRGNGYRGAKKRVRGVIGSKRTTSTHASQQP
jgi:hypothetical protein